MTASPAVAARPVLGVAHREPDFEVPAGACDCHVHVFGPFDRFPLAADRLYRPGPAVLADLMAHQRALGLDRVVIVQPSPYGADNACLLDALHHLGGRGRGVAVVAADAPTTTLRDLHEAGIRGLRINLETAGLTDPQAARRHLERAAAQAAPFGWHVQVYADPGVIAALHDVIRALPVPVVLDHFARIDPAKGWEQPGVAALLSLMRAGKAYVKLSAPRRISRRPDHADAGEIARRLAEFHPDRLLWGSDWPHPGAWPGVPRDPSRVERFHPDDDGLALNRLDAWIGSADGMRRILVENPALLYGF